MFGSLGSSRPWLAAFVGLIVAWTPSWLTAAEPASDGVLVLRNGNVLCGVVQQVGDYYRIESAGATLQVPQSQVEMRCRTVDEAYELRRSARGGSTADSHVELAYWCLRHDLLEHAARELLDARTLDPGHPALASLELQLEQIVQIRANRQQSAARAPVAASAPRPATTLPTESPMFDVSTEAREQFVRRIQPMLIHTCATGGCHQPGSARRLQLNRWAIDGNGNATFVRRNLAAVVEQIRQEDPAASPLLDYARQEHGAPQGALSKPLEPHQQTLLVDWMNEAAGYQPQDAVDASLPIESDAADATIVPERTAERAAAGMKGAPRGLEPPLPAALTPAVAAAPLPPGPFVPRDPFDAEIFNRRVASRNAAPGRVAKDAPAEAETSAPAKSAADQSRP